MMNNLSIPFVRCRLETPTVSVAVAYHASCSFCIIGRLSGLLLVEDTRLHAPLGRFYDLERLTTGRKRQTPLFLHKPGRDKHTVHRRLHTASVTLPSTCPPATVYNLDLADITSTVLTVVGNVAIVNPSNVAKSDGSDIGKSIASDITHHGWAIPSTYAATGRILSQQLSHYVATRRYPTNKTASTTNIVDGKSWNVRGV